MPYKHRKMRTTQGGRGCTNKRMWITKSLAASCLIIFVSWRVNVGFPNSMCMVSELEIARHLLTAWLLCLFLSSNLQEYGYRLVFGCFFVSTHPSSFALKKVFQSAPKMMKEVKMMKEMAIQMAKELSWKMGSKWEMFKLGTSGVAKAYWEDTALVHKNASIATTVYVVNATVQATMTALSKKDKEALLSLTTEANELRSELTKNTTALTSLCAEVQAFKTLLSSRRSNLHEVQETKKTGVRKLLELPCCSPLLASQLPPRH